MVELCSYNNCRSTFLLLPQHSLIFPSKYCFIWLKLKINFYIFIIQQNFPLTAPEDYYSIFRDHQSAKPYLWRGISCLFRDYRVSRLICFFSELDDLFRFSSPEWDSKFCFFLCCSQSIGFRSFYLLPPISPLVGWFRSKMFWLTRLFIDF